jgi:integrase
MPRKRQQRLYTKRGRYYGDFRDFKDVGGRKEALISTGERFATADKRRARAIARERLRELKALRRAGPCDATLDLTRLGDLVDHYLLHQARRPDVDVARLKQLAQRLEYAVQFFGADRKLRHIDTLAVEEYLRHLARKLRWDRAGIDGAPAGTITAPTQRKYLHALSRLMRRARALGLVAASHDPVANLEEVPSGRRHTEAEWLEHDEAALLLYAASLYAPKRSDSVRYALPLIATLLLTGARLEEVLGLQVEDVYLDRRTIRIRSRADRRLKTPGSSRSVAIVPQLAEILVDYLEGPLKPTGTHLFPSPRGRGRLRTADKLLDELAERMGTPGRLISRIFRHTYSAARLQTTDRGLPVSTFQVARELGHEDEAMVQSIYGHLGSHIAPRGEHVEFRLEQFDSPQFAVRMAEIARISAERNEKKPQKKKLPIEVELAAVQIALEMGDSGPRPAATELRARGWSISASGVRLVWKRHGLDSIERRRQAKMDGRLRRLIADLRGREAA